jgi:hypothetical protein
MYRGFKLNTTGIEGVLNRFTAEGNQLFNEHTTRIKLKLDGFVLDNGTLSASDLESAWFPDFDAHVFISHSHKDADLAIGLAGWLHKNMGITSFIDSCVWGYSNKLLRRIDDERCYNQEKKVYDYSKRNRSTSHIHMMLMVALTKMIDECECCLVLDTPNAISVKGTVANTYSPWIYAELETMRMIRKRTPDRLKDRDSQHYMRAEIIVESLLIDYQVSLEHLESIQFNDLRQCAQRSSSAPDPNTALNALYSRKPLNP